MRNGHASKKGLQTLQDEIDRVRIVREAYLRLSLSATLMSSESERLLYNDVAEQIGHALAFGQFALQSGQGARVGAALARLKQCRVSEDVVERVKWMLSFRRYPDYYSKPKS